MQTRLLVAFLGVAVVPMLISTWLAADIVSNAFESNIQDLLRETSTFFLRTMRDEEREAAAAAEFIASNHILVDSLVSGSPELPANYATMLKLSGYDVVAIIDDRGGLVFSNTPVAGISTVELGGDQVLYRAEVAGKPVAIVGGSCAFDVHGQDYTVVVGSWLDEDFIQQSKLVTSMALRIFYRSPTGFTQAYSTLGDKDAHHELPALVLTEMKDGEDSVYLDQAEDGNFRAVYTPLKSSSGEVVGVIFCGLSTKRTLSGFVTRRNLFGGVFLIGSVLSIGAAVWLSRRLVVPLRSLSQGVKAVSEGNYGHSVAVLRDDEIGELTRVFNEMSHKLETMRELEQQLRRRDRLSALGEMALGIAHEVRNPLGIIKTSAELLRRKADLPAHHDKLFVNVIEEVGRIDAIITEFMAFASPSSGELQSINLADTIDRVCSICEPQFAKHGIQLTFQNDAPNERILGDERLLYQAFLNLVLNAIEAMPDGGRFDVHLHWAPHSIVVDVSDTGTGIPDDLRERVFNPFFTTKESGTGLGLPQVYAVMERHAGSIQCMSEPDSGTTFRLVFPTLSAVTSNA